jgi:hypothetical protein
MEARRCAFCRVPGHCKPQCEKYKVFLKMYALLLLVPNRIPFTDVNQVQRIFWKFYTNDTVSLIDLQNMSNEMFEDYISSNQNDCIREVLRKYSPRYSANERQVYGHGETRDEEIRVELNITESQLYESAIWRWVQNESQVQNINELQLHGRIALELCANTSGETVAECGICLSSDIPCANMVKLGCGHEFCGDCAEMFINVKPCCAFCRTDVKKVSVGSEVVLSKYKKNSLFVEC